MNPFGVYVIAGLLGTLWVAFDARRFDWSRNSFCDRTWKWAVGCLFLFGIAFPAYLFQRRNVPLRGSGGFGTATPTFSSYSIQSGGAAAAAIDRAVGELTSSRPPIGQPEFDRPASAAVAKPPLLVSPTGTAERAHGTREGSLAVALLAGAAVALVGGLVWAGAVIATRYDIGFLAWFVGAATGGTIYRLYGAPVRGVPRVLAGLLAAGAIIAGKYVIFVHDVKKVLGGVLAQQGVSVGYLDTRQMGIFVHHFGSIVRPIYGLWVLFAFMGAVITADGRKTRMGRRR
jgi:uncharacterized membrane protein YecN with MAPEG domain